MIIYLYLVINLFHFISLYKLKLFLFLSLCNTIYVNGTAEQMLLSLLSMLQQFKPCNHLTPNKSENVLNLYLNMTFI